MGKHDRKQKKKKERQERLRKEKHERHFAPGLSEEGPGLSFVEEGLEFPDQLPSPFATERMMRDLHGTSGNAKEQAQDLAYQAMEAPDADEAVGLARRALQLDPDCVDALTTLADVTARSRDDRIEQYRHAVQVGERALGPRFFEENRGHFWGLLETRPYMRARAYLASLLRAAGQLVEATGHYEALLDLNPNDNQGNRDALLACDLALGNLEGAQRLFKQYEDEIGVVFAWGRVLERFLARDYPGATAALHKARKANPYVEPYLVGKKHLPAHLPEFYSFGDENEAISGVNLFGDTWKRHAEVLAWLRSGKLPGADTPGGAGKPPPGASQVNLLDNSDARKWLAKLWSGTDPDLIVSALDVTMLPAHLSLRTFACRELLAAAEVVAAGRGRPSPHQPRQVLDWLVAQDMAFSPGVVQMAREGVQRVCERSELRQLWDQSPDGQAWLRAAEDLQRRLQD
jgi:tetratricopeptide (TPR) repeat protein